MSAHVAVKMHAMGASFVKNVTDAGRTAGDWNEGGGPEDMVERKAPVTGHQASVEAACFKELHISLLVELL